MADPLNGYGTGTILNLAQAQSPEEKSFSMNPQEEFLYGLHKKNLASGGVPNQGKTSTLFAGTHEIDGKHYMLPGVWDGKIINDPKEIVRRATEMGLDKFPAYGSETEAEARYQQMHDIMEQDVAPVPQPEQGKPNRMRENFLKNQKMPKQEGYSIPADRPAPERGMLERLLMSLIRNGPEQ